MTKTADTPEFKLTGGPQISNFQISTFKNDGDPNKLKSWGQHSPKNYTVHKFVTNVLRSSGNRTVSNHRKIFLFRIFSRMR